MSSLPLIFPNFFFTFTKNKNNKQHSPRRRSRRRTPARAGTRALILTAPTRTRRQTCAALRCPAGETRTNKIIRNKHTSILVQAFL